ncbi:hypothetical protein E2C01_025222 [Portunus trituberculatus]|uniref:Uncharacterized protein n=1 Tax=Portunus trituberculatus TaxID=210409 RepID=A0A5B7ECS4_PORTR|nr:hypothetical protein [Portunus trituberculatus]
MQHFSGEKEGEDSQMRRKAFDSTLSNKTCKEYSIQGRIRSLYRVPPTGRGKTSAAPLLSGDLDVALEK